jgi:predicted Fe-Mo cluster-binding NifX family protein
MKIAIALEENRYDSNVDRRVGRASYFILVDSETNEYEIIENEAKDEVTGAGLKVIKNLVSLGVEELIAGEVGPKAIVLIEEFDLPVYRLGELTTVKEILVISGKGGTGKTTITSSIIPYFDSLVIGDCDVDAPNLKILLNPSEKEKNGNGMENIMLSIAKTHPEMLTPTSNGNIAKPFIMSFWVLVGIGLLGYPSTTVRCMGFKDSNSLHRAMIIGTSVVGLLMLGMHLVGVMGVAVAPGVDVGDKIIPILALKNLHPILAGVFIGGPLAAIMSTVDSLLIMTSATIVKDLYSHYVNKEASTEKIKKLSFMASLGFGIIVFLLSFYQKESFLISLYLPLDNNFLLNFLLSQLYLLLSQKEFLNLSKVLIPISYHSSQREMAL